MSSAPAWTSLFDLHLSFFLGPFGSLLPDPFFVLSAVDLAAALPVVALPELLLVDLVLGLAVLFWARAAPELALPAILPPCATAIASPVGHVRWLACLAAAPGLPGATFAKTLAPDLPSESTQARSWLLLLGLL